MIHLVSRRTTRSLATVLGPRIPAVTTTPAALFSTNTTTATSTTGEPEAPTTTPSNKGMLGNFLDRMSIPQQQRRIQIGESMFQAAVRQAQDARWYGPGRIPRTFRSRHAMISMHLWFLHKRLVGGQYHPEGNGEFLTHERSLQVQEELFDIFWSDTQCRMRGEGVYEMKLEKSLLQVQQYTFLHLFHYDHIYQALASSQSPLDPDDDPVDELPMAPPAPTDGTEEMDPLAVLDPTLDLTKVENRITELKKLIWMHIMVRDPAAKESDDHLERLAWYVEMQYQNILVDWPSEYVSQARIGWINLPDFSHLRDNAGSVMQERLIHPDDVVPEPWVSNITLRGETYYWNKKTRQSRWGKPTGQDLYNSDDKEAVAS